MNRNINPGRSRAFQTFRWAKNLFVCAVVALSAHAARAAVPITGPTIIAPAITAAAGSSGSFDILLFNNELASVHIAGDSVQLGVSGTGVQFTNTTIGTVTPYIYPDSFDADNGFDLDATGVPYPKTDFIVSDLDDAPSSFQVVAPGSSYGLARVFYSVDPTAAVGSVHNLTIEDVGGGTSLSDENGIAPPFTVLSGTLTVIAAPEPASITLLLLGAPLLLRRRRH